MGGQYEDTIEKPSRSKGQAGQVTVSKIRIHESGGEVHFHDDDAKLKVAVPVHVWSAAWDGLRSGEQAKFGYIDTDKGTALTVALVADGGSVDVELAIDKVKFGTAYEKLNKFSEAV